MLNVLNFIGSVISTFFGDITYPFTILFGAFFLLGLICCIKKLIGGDFRI